MYTIVSASGAVLAHSSQEAVAQLAALQLCSHYGQAACHVEAGERDGPAEQPTPRLETEADCELVPAVLAYLKGDFLITDQLYTLRGMLWQEAHCVQGVWITYAPDYETAEQHLRPQRSLP